MLITLVTVLVFPPKQIPHSCTNSFITTWQYILTLVVILNRTRARPAAISMH